MLVCFYFHANLNSRIVIFKLMLSRMIKGKRQVKRIFAFVWLSFTFFLVNLIPFSKFIFKHMIAIVERVDCNIIFLITRCLQLHREKLPICAELNSNPRTAEYSQILTQTIYGVHFLAIFVIDMFLKTVKLQR